MKKMYPDAYATGEMRTGKVMSVRGGSASIVVTRIDAGSTAEYTMCRPSGQEVRRKHVLKIQLRQWAAVRRVLVLPSA